MIWLYAGFVAFVLLVLTLDLGIFHRKAHVDTMKEALAWSAMWIAVGLSFSIFVYFGYKGQWLGLGTKPDPIDRVVNDGWTAVQKYLTGYIVEESLSMDNVFVIAMMFGFFAVPPMYRHRVLFWGILGAIVMRGVMIGIGAKLVAEFHWILYIFGVFLIVTAFKMLFLETGHKDPNRNPLVRLARRLFPITARYHGEHFIVRAGTRASRESQHPGVAVAPDEVVDRAKPGTLLLTPLALALAVIESTDVIFAVDSIPAIFAITADPFLVFTSNVCAILGLRSLYFVLAGMMDKFRYLKVSLALVLMVVGVKMLVAEWLRAVIGEHFNFYLLVLVFLILAGGIVASWALDRRARRRPAVVPEQSRINPSRLSYDDSIRRLQDAGHVGPDEHPPMPDHLPQPEDNEPLGLSFFRTFVGDGADFGDLTMPRTFFGRSEIRGVSFRNTDLTESNLRWNDFVDVDFTDAVLTRADLRASCYKRVRFVRCDLRSADLRRCDFEECVFEGASMDGARLTKRQGKQMDLSDRQKAVIDWHTDDGPEPSGG